MRLKSLARLCPISSFGFIFTSFSLNIGENLLDEIAAEVEVSQLNKARLEGLVDRIANVFVFVVVALAVAVRPSLTLKVYGIIVCDYWLVLFRWWDCGWL